MITKDTLKPFLLALGFEPDGLLPTRLSKHFPEHDAYLVADFDSKQLIFPSTITINRTDTCNFKADENFVVFECVHRLMTKGYKPEHIELEPTWKVGHGGSGGRADVLVKDNTGKSLLIIECKTEGKEYTDAWRDTLHDGGQLFSYVQQARSTQYVCLYASGLDGNGQPVYHNLVVRVHDNPKLLEQYATAATPPPTFIEATDNKGLFQAWRDTYKQEYATKGIFEADIQPYRIGKQKFGVADLNTVGHGDIQGKYHQFATILRQHNVAGRENAFDKLVNLFLCKIVDEMANPHDLKFYWKGVAYDSDFDLQDRLQLLYKEGMRTMLKEEVTYITNEAIDGAFRFVRNDPDATRETIKNYFRQLKFFTNNDFAFIDVHNEKLFYQNAEVLLKLVQMLQDIRLRSDEPNQFLGDLFEGFLDAGVKQSEGQFFTPIPIVRFLLNSLPLGDLIARSTGPVRGLDYACGAGHFLTELASELRVLEPQHRPDAVPDTYDQGLYGIEKEYRLSKVAKVSAFMYGQTGTHIVYADALAQHPDIEEGSFDLLVANPPYSVKGFLETLSEAERQRYELYKRIDRKTLAKNNSIETFFIERAQQLLRAGGVAAIVLPSSILSNGKTQYVGTRELLLKFFDIVAIAQLGARTFGKTGTNTVTLFLRRKAERPAPATHYFNRVQSWFAGPAADAGGQAVYTDEYFIRQYCQHQDWDFDHYKTLLEGTPSEDLLAYELFKEYRLDFDKLTETKALLKNKYFKAKPAPEQKEELTARFIKYLRAIEQDKLYYFVLAAAGSEPGNAPRQVVIIKSPSDNQAQKQFLGYDWSGAKGSEGIKYLTGGPVPKDKPGSDEAEAEENEAADENNLLENLSKLSSIQTTLYDPKQRANPSKLNHYIEQNFKGQDFTIPEELQPFLSTARLVDMLDFKRIDFDKAFSLTPKKSLRAASHWPLQKLSNLVQIISGGTPDTNRPEYWNGTIPWLSVVDFNSSERYVSQSEKTITEAGVVGSSTRYLNVGDLIISARGTVGALAEVAVPATFNQSCYGLRPKQDLISSGYLYYTLKEEIAQFKANAGGSKFDAITIKTFDDIVIAVPPADVQAQIVSECEAIEAEVAAADAAVAQAKADMAARVQEVYTGGFPTKKLSALALRNPSKTELKGVPDDTMVSFVDMASVSNDGYIERQVLRPLRELRKGSYTYFAENDIILAKITPCMENGKSALASGLSNGLALGSSEFHVIRAQGEVLPAYLFTLLNRAEVREEAERNMTGSSGHRRAPITFYENLIIPVPNMEVQQALLTNLTALQAQVISSQLVVEGAAAKKQAVLQQHLQSAPILEMVPS